MATGLKTNSQKKVWSFFFDLADPTVNYADGTYFTDIIIKNNSVVTMAGIKPTQDWSTYSAGEIFIGCAGGINIPHFDKIGMPPSSPPLFPGEWGVSQHWYFLQTDGSSWFYPSPATGINPNNAPMSVSLFGFAGVYPAGVSFEYFIEVIEFDF